MLTMRFGAFVLDSARRQLLRDGGEIHLTPKAFDLLALLAAEAPRVVKKDEIHARLWPGTFVVDATLVGLVKELRKALDDRDESAPIIRTAHGVGYAFAAAIERSPQALPAVSRWITSGGRRIVLGEGENILGRDPAATVLVDVSGVSRRHARIVIDGSGARLEDLGSKNGTKVGDTRVSGLVTLKDGDQISLGPARIVFHASTSGISTDTVVA